MRNNQTQKWCKEHYVNHRVMLRAVEIRNQLRAYLRRYKVNHPDRSEARVMAGNSSSDCYVIVDAGAAGIGAGQSGHSRCHGAHTEGRGEWFLRQCGLPAARWLLQDGQVAPGTYRHVATGPTHHSAHIPPLPPLRLLASCRLCTFIRRRCSSTPHRPGWCTRRSFPPPRTSCAT